MENYIPWLLESPPWVQYRTRLDLLHEPEGSPQVASARTAMLAHPQVQALLAEAASWPGPVVKRHNDASLLLHKLAFLADLGLQVTDPPLEPIVESILNQRSPEGMFQVVTVISPNFGGSGQDQWLWMLCDTPAIIYSLAKMGLQAEARIQQAARTLTGFLRGNGWPCAVAPEAGRFRGPGRKDDPCPYATLVSLKALAQFPEWADSQVCRTGAESLLQLWQRRKETKPYLFGMGSDFVKLKAPLIWYDILHTMDVLTQFEWLHADGRLREMVEIIRGKADAEGRFTPESVWMAWKEWDFGQKRAPSPWLTLLAQRVIQRMRM
ncbi:MAG TPA: hypothetical protein VII97_14385 [Anaerolineales bacterium]